MKTIGLIGLMGLILAGCEKTAEPLIRKEAHKEIAENAGKAERERILTADLEFEMKMLRDCKEAVARARTPNDLVLAEDELRECRRRIAKIERGLEECR